MPRRALAYLDEWLKSVSRKPICIRGARQVGKTYLVREFAKKHKKRLIELNFEKSPHCRSYFDSNEPTFILKQLSASLGEEIDPQKSVLFLDEIQAAPILLSKLRWFAEEMPELPVLAAGSLLEFVLDKHEFSMPVGRITYMHLEPLSFEEFLDAYEKKILLNYLENFSWGETIPIALHQQLLHLFKEYILVGGMPAAVYSWVQENSLQKVNQIHHDLLNSYRDDFSKYAGRIATSLLEDVLVSAPKMLGHKFVFRRVNPETSSISLKQALHLLSKARIVHKVYAAHGNGVPLSAEKNEKYFKVIFLDVGLVSAMLNLKFDKISSINDINLINSGGISEQVVGQLLRNMEPFYIQPALFYWVREEKKANAEVDYLIQAGQNIIPLEVKSGATGSLKSLHLFMDLKKLGLALRMSSDVPSKTRVRTKTHLGEIAYELVSLPFYLMEQTYRLL